MYNPAHFVESRDGVLRALMEQYPLAALISSGAEHLCVTHLPLLCGAEGGLVLRGHMARANSHWHDHAGGEAVAIFHGPQHYVSPGWYPSKAEHGKVVPTWNYVVVHARGTLEFIHDPAWLLENVRALTAAQERLQPQPWSVDDAPPEYIDKLLNAIVGVELRVSSLEGKWKVSQNRPVEDREGVIAGLEQRGAAEMARLVRDYLGTA